MNKIIFLLCLTTALHGQTATPAMQKRLDDLRQSFESAAARQAGPAYDSALKSLNAKYLAALDRLIGTATQSGKLEEAITLRDEKKRVDNVLPLPVSDAEAPEALRRLRSTYRDQLAAIEATRSKSLAPLQDRYLAELAKLQADSTKAGKLEDALTVKTVIDSLQSSADTGDASGSSSDKPVVAKGSGKTDAKAAQAICEWALTNKAIVVTSVGKVGEFEQLKMAPKGKFSVLEINMPSPASSFPWELLAGLGEITHFRLNFHDSPTPIQLSELGKLSLLRLLDFSSHIPTESLAALPFNPLIGRLYFGSDNVEKDLLLLTARFPSVYFIELHCGNNSDDESVCKALQGFKKLADLHLRIDFSANGARFLAQMPNLTNLMIHTGAKISPGAFRDLKQLKGVQINGPVDTPGLIAEIASLPLLTDFFVDMNGKPLSELVPLQSAYQLMSLHMEDLASPANDATATIGKLKKLNALTLASCDLNDAGLQPLLDLKSLETLNLTGTHITDAGIMMLKGLKELNELNVTGSQVTDAGVAAFKKILPKCKVIH